MGNLLIEIGNTALKAAWAEGVTLGRIYRYQGEKRIDFIVSLAEKERPATMVVASVVGIAPVDERRLRKYCADLVILDSAHTSIAERYGLPSYLGYDRAAAIIAVKYLFKGKACTLMDFGTTFTVDFIAADGSYLGGNTSLGCRTRFKALNRYSRTLPLVDTPVDTPALGTSTTSSIEAGVISGIMFEIHGYTALYPENITVFTGGDAIYFANKMKNSIFVVCNLVLMGLALMTEDYVAQKSI